MLKNFFKWLSPLVIFLLIIRLGPSILWNLGCTKLASMVVDFSSAISEVVDNFDLVETTEEVTVDLGEIERVRAQVFATRAVVIEKTYSTDYLGGILSVDEHHVAACTMYFSYAQSTGLTSLDGTLNSVPLTIEEQDGIMMVNYEKASFLCPVTIDAIETSTDQLESVWSTFCNGIPILVNSVVYTNKRTQMLIEEDIPAVTRLMARDIEQEFISQLKNVKGAEYIIVNDHPLDSFTDEYLLWNEDYVAEEGVTLTYENSYDEYVELVNRATSESEE